MMLVELARFVLWWTGAVALLNARHARYRLSCPLKQRNGSGVGDKDGENEKPGCTLLRTVCRFTFLHTYSYSYSYDESVIG